MSSPNRDSIAPCRAYTNPYDVRSQSNPTIIKRRSEGYDSSRDVLETPQKRLERELLAKMLAKGGKIPINSLIVIGKIGKYAFLAITLPAYIFCYGVPKWLILQGFPKVYRQIKDLAKRVADKFSYVAHKCVAALRYLQNVTSPILAFIKTQIEKTGQLFNRMGYPFQRLGEILKNINFKVELNFEIVKQAQQKARDLAAAVVRLVGNAVGATTRLPGRLLATLSIVAEAAAKFAESMSNLQAQMKNALNRRLLSPLNAAGGALAKLLAKGRGLLPVFHNPLPVAEALARMLKRGKAWSDERMERVRDKYRKVARRVTEYTGRAIEVAQKAAVAIAQSAIALVPQPVFSLFTLTGKIVRASRALTRTKGKILEKMKRLKKKMKEGLQIFSRGFLKGMELCDQGLRWSFQKAKRALVRSYQLFLLLCAFIKNALKGTFFLLRLIFAWLKVLLRYSLLVAKESSRRLFLSDG